MCRNSVFALILFAGAAILPPAAQADTRSGVDAWSSGDYADAVRQWQAAAANGDVDAIFNLGQAYKLGKGVAQDLARAEELFALAAGRGHLQASDNYGLLLFQRGRKEQALPFVKAAAERGDPRAQYLLGIAHFNGDMVPKDWPRAYALLSLARQQGLAQATPALQQMDQHIPMAQRQLGAALAGELQAKADATRARQLAAADLGASNSAPPPPSGAIILPAAPQVQEPAVAGRWRVQLGAFGRPANADALWNRVKARAELSGHSRIDIRSGTVTRLQASGFPSQSAAQAACAALKADGFDCVAVSG